MLVRCSNFRFIYINYVSYGRFLKNLQTEKIAMLEYFLSAILPLIQKFLFFLNSNTQYLFSKLKRLFVISVRISSKNKYSQFT